MAEGIEVQTENTKTLFFPMYLSDADKTTQAGAMVQTILRRMGDKVLTEWAQTGRKNTYVDVTITLKEVPTND